MYTDKNIFCVFLKSLRIIFLTSKSTVNLGNSNKAFMTVNFNIHRIHKYASII